MTTLIIGSEGLIGKQLCLYFKQSGNSFYGLDLAFKDREHSLEQNQIVFDASSEDQCFQIINFMKDRKIKITSVVNCVYPSNKGYHKPLDRKTLNEFSDNVALHTSIYFNIMNSFGKYFSEIGGGNVISFSSIYGNSLPKFEIYEGTGFTMPIEYAAIKAAIIQMNLYFAKYYKKNAVRFNCISPGGIFNDQDENFVKKYNSFSGVKGMLDANDLFSTLDFLLDPRSKFVTGQNIKIDDGFSL